MKKLNYLLLSCSLALGACEDNILRGNGPILSETRNTAPFEEIYVEGAGDLHIVHADTFSVEVRDYANLLPHYESVAVDGRLRLGYRRDINVNRSRAEIFISMPLIKGLEMKGAGGADLAGDFPAVPELGLKIEGSGDIRAGDLEVASLLVDINGSGMVDMGSSDSEKASVRINGSGDVRLEVSNELQVRITGSGKVFYRGSPAISTEISGSGEVIKL